MPLPELNAGRLFAVKGVRPDGASFVNLTQGRPEISVLPGGLTEAIDRAEGVLVANHRSLQLFQRGGEIVRIVSLDRREESDHLRRPEGAIVLSHVGQNAMLDILNRHIAWKGQHNHAKDCPPDVARQYLARAGHWKIPTLVGVIEAPAVRLDGAVIGEPGFDDATGIFFHSSFSWPSVPETPTRAKAEDALRILLDPFTEFPFVGDEDKAVMVAAILTVVQRRLLLSAPIFGFSAPSQGSGKSLLVDILARLGTGRDAPAAGVPGPPEEMRKLITSFLREGHLIASFDNILHPLDSADLARAITQPVYSDRLLGVNQVLHLPTNIVWFATGNNLALKGDLPSRALMCRIDPQLERPEEREFKIKNIKEHIVEHRTNLVTAALTILRAYYVAGRPNQNIKPFGRFEEWSAMVREPLIWLSLADPCLTRDNIIAGDSERKELAFILSVWHEAIGDHSLTAKQVIKHTEKSKVDGADDPGLPNNRLRSALLEVAASKDNPEQIDSRRLGGWCSKNMDRVVDDLKLRKDGQEHRAITWRVVSLVSPVSSV